MSMSMLNNDVLSIISLYADIPMHFNYDKLIIYTDNKCESCGKRMRRTHKSLVEAYAFPKLWEIDDAFNNETGKYIRVENTFIKINKQLYTFEQAKENGFFSYYNRYNYSNDDQIYGAYLTHHVPLTIFVKKAPSLKIFYKALRDVIGKPTEEAFLNELKKFEEEGLDENIMNRVINRINITNRPSKIVIRLCSQCRKKLKKGYIFT